MVYGYIRVSTDRQTVENQRFEILRFCKKNSLEVGAWIEETISGTLTPDKRELGRLLSHIRKDDLIICSELSRLGRSLFMIMSILNLIMEKGAERASRPSQGKKKQRASSGRRGIPDKDNAPLGHEHKPNRAFCGCLPQHNKKMPEGVNLSRQARQ